MQLHGLTGALCRLSRSGEFFPGTKKRVILLMETLEAVLTETLETAVTSGNAMILMQLSEDAIRNTGSTGANGRGTNGRDHEVVPGRTAENFIAEIAAPNAGARAIIVKRGATINANRIQTGAPLHARPRKHRCVRVEAGKGGV